MLLLLEGIAILGGLLLLGYLFAGASPAVLARALKWSGIALAGIAVLGLAFSGRLLMLLGPLAVLASVIARWRGSGFRWFGSPAARGSSDVETVYVRMHLDHDTGAMHGIVLRGRFAGLRFEELALPELLILLRECRAADEDGARLIEAYLDRAHPEWRDDLHAAEPPRPSPRADVSVEEAYDILGLKPGADEAAIRAAHHRLMKQLHPDHGGSDYLAGQVNRARDVLLHK